MKEVSYKLKIIYVIRNFHLRMLYIYGVNKTLPHILKKTMLTIQEILNLKTDILKKSRVKLVRHKDNRAEYRELIKDRNELLKYQQEQVNPIFHDCDYIVSFIGKRKNKTNLEFILNWYTFGLK